MLFYTAAILMRDSAPNFPPFAWVQKIFYFIIFAISKLELSGSFFCKKPCDIAIRNGLDDFR